MAVDVTAKRISNQEKQERAQARRRKANAAGARLVASAERCDDGAIELDLTALFACAKGPQKWISVSLDGGDKRVALPRPLLRAAESAIRRRAQLRCYYDPLRTQLCLRFTSGSKVPSGAGLNLSDQGGSKVFEPDEAVVCVVAGRTDLSDSAGQRATAREHRA